MVLPETVASNLLHDIFPELRETEDERIRKELWEYFHELELSSDRDFSPSFTIDHILAWLEKQKEQKPLSTEETELNSIAFLEQLGYTCIPPEVEKKLAEWSEEDEKRVKQLIYDTEAIRAGYEKRKEMLGERFNNELLKDWLKSLRPQPSWKPSEEQMKALLNIEGDLRAFQYKDKAKIIAELYEHLKKL